MPLIEGVGDEVTQFFIVLITVLVVCIAWWTTNISEQRHLRTVFLINRRSRSERAQRLTNHTEATTLVEGTATMPETTSEIVETEANASPPAPSKPPEPGSSVDAPPAAASIEEQEQNAIVQTMDADSSSVLRQRRIAFYEYRHDTLIDPSAAGEPAVSSESSDGNDMDEEDSQNDGVASAAGEYMLMEHNYARLTNDGTTNNSDGASHSESTPSTSNESSDASCIKIKLKYINDELKLVEGRLQESVGEFKRRHFETELNTNKIVRLIFNGKVLQQDGASLQTCGLFDNCVVHCLIHNKRPSAADANSATSNADDFVRRNHRHRIPQMNNNNNNQGRESDLGNILFALISFILGSAWYFRYVYAHLYTVTATVALVVVTGIFSVVVIGMYFPDQEAIPPRAENEQR